MGKSALDDLLSDFSDNVGVMPQVNPPEATKVLATQTAPEVAGEPEPEKWPEPPPPPTEKPADVVAREAASKQRRTAAVVQAELDVAMVEIASLRSQLDGARAGQAVVAQVSTSATVKLDLQGSIRLVASLTPTGTTISIPGEA
jgi:hypothetical protein